LELRPTHTAPLLEFQHCRKKAKLTPVFELNTVDSEMNVCTSLVVSVVFKLICDMLEGACATSMLELGVPTGEDALCRVIV